jgi:hypothetical protein
MLFPTKNATRDESSLGNWAAVLRNAAIGKTISM